MAKGHGKLIQNMVTAFAFVGTTLFMLTEFELEFDELVLLVWAILLPLLGFIGLIAPLIRESAEVRLYLVVVIVLPIALTYFYGSYYWPFDEAMLFALTLAPIVSLIRTIRASLKSQLPSYNRDFYKERLPELFLLLCVGVLPAAATTELGMLEMDDSVLLFFACFAPIAFAIHDSPALRVAREAVTENPSLFKRLSVIVALIDALIQFSIAVLAPIAGYYASGDEHLEMDEAVMFFPCGLLPLYCLAKVATYRLLSCMWNEVAGNIGPRMRESTYGSMKNLGAFISSASGGGSSPPWKGMKKPPKPPPAKSDGLRRYPELDYGYGDLSAAEEAVRQERRSMHGMCQRAPSAPTTPRVQAVQNGHAWHHRHHHYGAETASDAVPVPKHLKDPLYRGHHEGRQATADEKDDKKKFKHRSHSMASSAAGAIELPEVPMFDPSTAPPADGGSGRRWHHQQHRLDGSIGGPDLLGKSATRKGEKPAEKAADGGGGGGFFGFFRSKTAAPVQPAVPEGRESQARWSDDDGSPMRNRRKSRSNSFSLSIARRNRDIASGRQAASSLDAPESASDAADVKALKAKRGKGAGVNSEDMYSA